MAPTRGCGDCSGAPRATISAWALQLSTWVGVATEENKPLPRRIGVRNAVAAIGLGSAVVVLVVVILLVWMSRLLDRSLEAVSRDERSRALLDAAELDLLTYNRISNLYVVTRAERDDATRNAIRADLMARLRESEQFIGAPEEKAALDHVAGRIQAYLEARESLEASTNDLDAIVRSVQPTLNEAVATIGSLSALNTEQVERAEAHAYRISRIADLVAVGFGGVFIIALAMVIPFINRSFVKSSLALHETMWRFREGDYDVRAREHGLRELAELARGFNEMADALARQRERQLAFLAGVAHDLRNPLAGLKLALYVAFDDQQPEETRRATRERADRLVDRLARMIDDLLDATRIESGHLDLQMERFDLRVSVEDVVRLYRSTSPDHTIDMDIPTEPVVVECDQLRVEQVVSNLLSNAIKFSPPGSTVSVELCQEDDDVVVSITDAGVGIATEDVPELFLPFRRRRPDLAPGVGLGLSVVRRIVNAHQGQIEVESEPGAGATFRVRLPRLGLSKPTERPQRKRRSRRRAALPPST